MFSDIIKILGPFKRIAEGGKLVPIDYEEMKKFDLDLKIGHFGEDFVRDLQNGNTMIEVKTERDIWKTTGNIAIEIRCNGKLSGLSATESQTWVHLLSVDDKIIGGFIFDTDYLKDMVKKVVANGKAKITKGGDFNSSQMVLIPIEELFKP